MALSTVLQAVLAPLLSFAVDGQPVRFGVPLPAAALANGLSLKGRGVLQWRVLPAFAGHADLVWIEVAVVAPPGTVQVVPLGHGPSPEGRGQVFVREQHERRLPHGVERRESWQWCDGTIDQRVRTAFTADTTIGGELFRVGEAHTEVTDGLARRASPWLGRRTWAVAAGLMPAQKGGGAATRDVRRQLALVVDRLVELPGERGAGDFGRSDGVVTNLEFDTCLALLRCALGLGSERAWQLTLRSAVHLRDRDLDAATGLPFVHGPDHRSSRPEPGHVWLQGLLSVGLVTADDEAITTACSIGRALAASLPSGTGSQERLRDFAWPLLELEALLAFLPEPVVAKAADRLAAAISLRFDAAACTFRFGEGELGSGLYFERGWLTGGLLLPALRRHLQRRPNADLQRKVDAVHAALLDRIGSRGDGLPTHWRTAGGHPFAEHREGCTVAACFLLEGLLQRDLLRVLRRGTVRRAIAETPALDDPDLATSFTLLGRCDWVWR